MNTRTNTITPPTLTPRKYDTIGAISSELDIHIEFNAPDYKSCIKAMDVVVECRETPSRSSASSDDIRDMLYDLGGAFEEMADRAHYKANGKDTPTYVKHAKRAAFYGHIAEWAGASLDLMEQESHQSPTKDAEDDSDPYTPQAPASDTPLTDLWQKIASTLTDSGYSASRIARARTLFDEAVEAVWKVPGTGSDLCRILELFGDACANIDYTAPTDEKFWDACVMISDDLRATIAAENIKARSTYTQPAPPTPMPLVSTRSEEFVTAGVMWEVAGDVSRSLCRTKTDAEAWARVLFPSELVDKRYARIQSRTIIAK